MNITEIIFLCVIGLVAGVASGTLGIGGGIIIVPALMVLLGLTQHQAQGTSLALMLPPIGILAAINYYKAGHINIKYAIILSATFLIGGYLGSKFALNIDGKILKKVFGVFMIIVAIKMIIDK